ncbi:MAG TPA: hypothetical protein ENJ57_08455 [Rhizobiales bacterium]|nr:hypothetical protein [Hyphomicrobiales bacterium]
MAGIVTGFVRCCQAFPAAGMVAVLAALLTLPLTTGVLAYGDDDGGGGDGGGGAVNTGSGSAGAYHRFRRKSYKRRKYHKGRVYYEGRQGGGSVQRAIRRRKAKKLRHKKPRRTTRNRGAGGWRTPGTMTPRLVSPAARPGIVVYKKIAPVKPPSFLPSFGGKYTPPAFTPPPATVRPVPGAPQPWAAPPAPVNPVAPAAARPVTNPAPQPAMRRGPVAVAPASVRGAGPLPGAGGAGGTGAASGGGGMPGGTARSKSPNLRALIMTSPGERKIRKTVGKLGSAQRGTSISATPGSGGPSVLGVLDTVTGPLFEAVPGALAASGKLNMSGNANPNLVVDLRTLKSHPKLKALIKATRNSKGLAKIMEKSGDVLTVVKLALKAADMSSARTEEEYSQAVDNYVRESCKAMGSLTGAQAGIGLATTVAGSTAVPSGGVGAVVGVLAVPAAGILGAVIGGYTAGKAYDKALSAGVRSIARDYYVNSLTSYESVKHAYGGTHISATRSTRRQPVSSYMPPVNAYTPPVVNPLR